jgi:hypothetical protein
MDVFTQEQPGLTERYAAWSSGWHDDEMGFAVAVAKGCCSEPIAEVIYDLHVMEFSTHDYATKARRVKDWGYLTAARFVAAQRGRARVMGYRLDWGRQAARDGLGIAMWGDLYGVGLSARPEVYAVARWSYERVRNHVRASASALVTEFACELATNSTNLS